MQEIILASSNQGKIKEFQSIFNKYNINIIPQGDLKIQDTNEPYTTFIENALQKARNASKYQPNKLILADDSGICAKALNGFPGIYSARYSKIKRYNLDNNASLNKDLAKHSNKEVYYYCILVLIKCEEDPTPIIAEGKLEGLWKNEAIGNNGFGYDPHFYLPKYKKTVAELSLEEKNNISHRNIAINSLIKQLIND